MSTETTFKPFTAEELEQIADYVEQFAEPDQSIPLSDIFRDYFGWFGDQKYPLPHGLDIEIKTQDECSGGVLTGGIYLNWRDKARGWMGLQHADHIPMLAVRASELVQAFYYLLEDSGAKFPEDIPERGEDSYEAYHRRWLKYYQAILRRLADQVAAEERQEKSLHTTQ